MDIPVGLSVGENCSLHLEVTIEIKVIYIVKHYSVQYSSLGCTVLDLHIKN